MPVIPIRTYGDPVLKQPTDEVTDIDAALVALAGSMIETMYAAPGVGLAANQVGVAKRMFVYDAGDGPFTIVNPRIVETDGEYEYTEGCLSVPGHAFDLVRPDRVHLVGRDLDGAELDIEADEYLGRIFQHEVDHLDGLLLIDRLDADQRREVRALLREELLGADDPDGLAALLER